LETPVGTVRSPVISSFSVRVLRRIAVSIGVPYADLSGDYSQANYSSSRMERLAHWQNVSDWQEHMLIPQLCMGVWDWVMSLAQEMSGWPSRPRAQWAAPPMPILEPDKEGLAYLRLVRIGAMTWSQMVRELGRDPVAQLDEIEAHNAELDRRGIVLDTDPRRMSGAGQLQVTTPADEAASADTADTAAQASDSTAEPQASDSTAEPQASDSTATKDTGEVRQEQPKVFSYHHPFMKVREIRENINLPGDVWGNEAEGSVNLEQYRSHYA
jgi:hypothetical protein